MIVLFSGKAGSGKSTTAEALRVHFGSRGVASFRYSLAEPIAAMAKAVYAVGKHYGIEGPPDGKDRLLYQALGDGWGNQKDPMIWVKAAKSKIGEVTKVWEEKKLLYLVIIERVCHPQQLEAWPNALRIRLDADEATRKSRCNAWPADPNHLSETALDNAKFDIRYNTAEMTVEEIVNDIGEIIRKRWNYS